MPLNLDKILKSLTQPFDQTNFTGLFYPFGVAALVLLIAAVLLYNFQTRRLHRHAVLVNREEWLLWTAICVFGLLLVEATFKFLFIFVIITLVLGLATFAWIVFVRFPPMIEIYNQQLRRARFFSQSRYKHPEATVRVRKATRTKRRRR
jgi:signal transduction histidine kinase